MEYWIYINKKDKSFESIHSSLSFIGRVELQLKKNICVLRLNDSVMYIDTALEYIKRVTDDDSIIDIKEHKLKVFRPSVTKKSNTRKKQGSGSRKKRK